MKRYWLAFCLLLLCIAFGAQAQAAFDPASVAAIDLDTIPVLPTVTETTRQIYTRGQAGWP